MEHNLVNVLLIDDDEDDYLLIRDMLKDVRDKEYQVKWLSTFQEARERLGSDGWDVVLVDYDLGAGNGLDLIREAVKKGVKTPFIMVTGRGRYELDVEAMKSGAADYLSKDMINSAVLERVIRYAIEQSRAKEVLEQLVQERTLELQNTLDELRVAEEELRTEHEALLEMSPILADESSMHRLTMGDFPLIEIKTDREGKILDWNQHAAHLFRAQYESLRGKLLSLFIHLKDRRRFVQLLTRLDELISPSTEKFNLWNENDGSIEWCLTVVPLKNQGRKTGEYYWLIHPIYSET